METLLSIITGFLLGGVFAFLNLPLPAPSHINGVIGILGVFLGYIIIKKGLGY